MPRIQPIGSREELPEEHRGIYDTIAESRGGVRGPFAVLLHSPQAADRVAALGGFLRFESLLQPKDEELAVIATAREMDCPYVWAAHTVLARRAGVREEAIDAIRSRRAPEGLTPEEAEIVTYVQQLVRRHRVEQPVFDALEKRFGRRWLVEFTTLLGHYGMVAGVLNAYEVAPAPDADPLPV